MVRRVFDAISIFCGVMAALTERRQKAQRPDGRSGRSPKHRQMPQVQVPDLQRPVSR
jgi:hypothetical protein